MKQKNFYRIKKNFNNDLQKTLILQIKYINQLIMKKIKI